MTVLELTLSKIAENLQLHERLRTAAKRRLRLKQNFLYNFFFARDQFFSSKRKRKFCFRRSALSRRRRLVPMSRSDGSAGGGWGEECRAVLACGVAAGKIKTNSKLGLSRR